MQYHFFFSRRLKFSYLVAFSRLLQTLKRQPTTNNFNITSFIFHKLLLISLTCLPPTRPNSTTPNSSPSPLYLPTLTHSPSRTRNSVSWSNYIP